MVRALITLLHTFTAHFTRREMGEGFSLCSGASGPSVTFGYKKVLDKFMQSVNITEQGKL